MEQLYTDKKLSRFTNEPSILEPSVESIMGTNILDVLVNLNLSSVENLLNQDKTYTQISKIMKHYKLLSWGTTFDKLLDPIELSCDSSTIATLLNESNQIMQKLEKGNQQTITSLLSEVLCFNSDGLTRRALGNENYELIKANPRPNAAAMSLSDRIEQVPRCLKIMKDREYVDVPPLDCEMILDNQKKIRTVVGNFTDPRILTLGERTGACMRIGGAGFSLFNFCLENEAGFHVEFIEPDTDKFISRVSGFINGNTVFLNELRNSVDENYTDQDVIEACKKVANYFINQTTNTTYPIDNVVISKQYAMNKTNDPLEQLPVEDIKKGLPGFYSDVSSNVIVLATREKEKKFADVMLDPTKTNRYYCLRTKPIFYDNSEIAQRKVNQLIAQETVMNNPTELIEDCNSAIVGEDWYLYEDKEGEIHSHIVKDLPDSKQKRAVEEVKIASMKYDEVIEEPVEVMNQIPSQYSFAMTHTSIEGNAVGKEKMCVASKSR